MAMSRLVALALLIAGAPGAATAATTLYRFDVTVITNFNSGFSAPIFDYFNLSSPGVTIATARIHNGPPWDYVANRAAPANIVNPLGGTRVLLEGQESAGNPNDGCTAGIKYGFTGFDTGESFHFLADPEGAGCSNAVVPITGLLETDVLTATVEFSGGVTLTGRDWVREYIDPNGSQSDLNNRLYRLSLQQTVVTEDPPPPVTGVPEPATWTAMIVGFGLVGAHLRRRSPTARGMSRP